MTDQNQVTELTNAILNAIRDYFEKDSENTRVVPLVLSALTANILAFVHSESTWDDEIKKDVFKRINDELMKALQ